MEALSFGQILFILLIAGMMAIPSGLFAFVVWRKVFRRIDSLEEEVDELRADPRHLELGSSSAPRNADQD